jgi:hypothetical protein
MAQIAPPTDPTAPTMAPIVLPKVPSAYHCSIRARHRRLLQLAAPPKTQPTTAPVSPIAAPTAPHALPTMAPIMRPRLHSHHRRFQWHRQRPQSHAEGSNCTTYIPIAPPWPNCTRQRFQYHAAALHFHSSTPANHCSHHTALSSKCSDHSSNRTTLGRDRTPLGTTRTADGLRLQFLQPQNSLNGGPDTLDAWIQAHERLTKHTLTRILTDHPTCSSNELPP